MAWPFTVLSTKVDYKLVYVQDVEIGIAKTFNVVQVKRYLRPETLSRSLFADCHRAFSHFASPAEDEIDLHLPEIIELDAPASVMETSDLILLCLRHFLACGSRVTTRRGLLDRGTFSVILRVKVPKDANVLPVRFVLAIKSNEDGH